MSQKTVKEKTMIELHNIPNNQRRWCILPGMCSIGLLLDVGNTCALFDRKNEFMRKRPEDIRMQ